MANCESLKEPRKLLNVSGGIPNGEARCQECYVRADFPQTELVNCSEVNLANSLVLGNGSEEQACEIRLQKRLN